MCENVPFNLSPRHSAKNEMLLLFDMVHITAPFIDKAQNSKQPCNLEYIY